jgi:hypothetical protein
MFVLGEELISSGNVEQNLVWQCCNILAFEVIVDVVKHSAMAKFNDIRPGIYREFFRCDHNLASERMAASHFQELQTIFCNIFCSKCSFCWAVNKSVCFVALQKLLVVTTYGFLYLACPTMSD